MKRACAFGLRAVLLVALFASFAPSVARAQGTALPNASSDPPSDAQPPRKPGDLVTISVENAELKDMVRMMSETTGRRFLVEADPKSFHANIVAPQKVTVAEAYEAFLAVLAANRLAVIPRGRFFAIVDAQDAAHTAPVVTSPGGLPGGARFVTYLRRVKHVPAKDLAADVLSKLASSDKAIAVFGDLLLVTDTAESIERMSRVLDQIDVAEAQDRVWLEPLEYVAAADVKKELDEVLGADGKGKDKDSGPPAGGQARVTRIVAVDRPNALLVVGTQAGYERLLELVRALDVAVPAEGQMHVVRLEHADAKKIVDAINAAVSAGQGAGGGLGAGGGAGGGSGSAARVFDGPVKVSAEETNNALIVTGNAHDYAQVREVIRDLDRPRQQVYIEAVVMDLSVARGTTIDTAFHGMGPVGGSTVFGGSNPVKSMLPSTNDPSALQAMVLGVQGPSITLPAGILPGTTGTTTIPGLGFFLDAYATTDDIDILSTPQILATDNVQAELHEQLNTSMQRNAPSYGMPGASGANPLAMYAAPASANYAKIGPKITVTPHITESDDVRLDITETISDTDLSAEGTLGTLNFTEREAQTTLTVKSGHTAVIGGLVTSKKEHTETKVPLLGDIPILGALFRSSVDTTKKGNLVLVLTPHIVRTEDDMRHIFEERMQERQEFLDHYFTFRDGPPLGFDPARGHGLLSDLRAGYAQVAAQRRLQVVPPPPPAAHEPKPPIDLPVGPGSADPDAGANDGAAKGAASGVTEPQAAPPALNVSPLPRRVDRVEE